MDVSWPPFRMMSRLEKIRFSTFAVGVRNRFSFESLMWENDLTDEGAASSSSLWRCRHSAVLCGPLTFSVHAHGE